MSERRGKMRGANVQEDDGRLSMNVFVFFVFLISWLKIPLQKVQRSFTD